jgi:hypothetical protein
MRIQDIKTGTKLNLELFNDLGEKIPGNFHSQFEVAKNSIYSYLCSNI